MSPKRNGTTYWASAGSSIALQTASWRAIWWIFNTKVHDRKPSPASVRYQQLSRRDESHCVNGCWGRHIHVRTRDAEHFGHVVHRHTEHTARHRAIEQEEVRSTIDRETRNRRHVIVVFNYIAAVCNTHVSISQFNMTTISWLDSLGYSLSADSNIMDQLQGEHPVTSIPVGSWGQDPTNFFPCPGPYIGGPRLDFHKI